MTEPSCRAGNASLLDRARGLIKQNIGVAAVLAIVPLAQAHHAQAAGLNLTGLEWLAVSGGSGGIAPVSGGEAVLFNSSIPRGVKIWGQLGPEMSGGGFGAYWQLYAEGGLNGRSTGDRIRMIYHSRAIFTGGSVTASATIVNNGIYSNVFNSPVLTAPGNISGYGFSKPIVGNSWAMGFDTAWGTSDVDHSFLFDVQSIELSLWPRQNVVLSFGTDVPYRIVRKSVLGFTYYVEKPGAMTAADMSGRETTLVNSVQQIFNDSGIDNVFVTTEPLPNAVTVYFAESIDPPGGDFLAGKARRIDRYNVSLDDQAVVMNRGTTERIGEVIAHEVGHALGLRHVNPDGAGALEVMDYDNQEGSSEVFINAESSITDLSGLGQSHNPIYHLRRYVDGIPRDELAKSGSYSPGSWDLVGDEVTTVFGDSDARVSKSLNFNNESLRLYEVYIVAGTEDDALETLYFLDSATLGEIEALQFDVNVGDTLNLFASSQLNGASDVALTYGDPYVNGLGVVIVPEDVSGLLAMEGLPGEFSVLTPVQIATTVPEPASLLTLVSGSFLLRLNRRRGSKR